MFLFHQSLRWQSNKGLLGAMMSLLLIACVFIQLYPTLNSYFIADDFDWLLLTKQDGNFLRAAFHPSIGDWTTPLSNLIFWIWFQAFGFDPRYYYLMIALVHLFNTWLVYHLAYLVIKRVDVAYGSASIFALHFIHFSDWGPLVWISAFVQIVMASFYLLCLWFFMRYLHSGKGYTYVGALVSFGLALASKETALTLPLLLLIWYLIRSSSADRQWTRLAIIFGPFFVFVGVYLLYKLLIQQTSNQYFELGMYGIGEHLITNWKYFSNLVMPNPQSPPVHSYLQRAFPSWTLSFAYLAAGAARIGLLIAGIIFWWRGTAQVRQWISLSLITYLPFIGFLGGYAGANRYFYLPTVGFSVLLATVLLWIFNHVLKQFKITASIPLMTIIIFVFWAYNLFPIRAWQAAMQSDSQTLQQTLYLVDEQIVNQTTPISRLYLTGFPPDTSRSLQKAIPLIYGADTILVITKQPDWTELSKDSVMLLYEANRVTIHKP